VTGLAVLLALTCALLAVALAITVWRQRDANERLGRLIDAPRSARRRSFNQQLGQTERSFADLQGTADDATQHRVRLERALNAIPHGVIVCGAAGEEVFHNQAATTYASARHGDALVEAAVDELLTDAVAGLPGTRALDLFGPPKRSLVVTALPLGGEPDKEGAIAVIEDTTERRRLEAVRRDFVANISHELKTPVGAVALLAETLLAEDDPAVRDRLAERMLVESDRVGRTIEDLLTLSQIESEEVPQREPVPVHVIFAEAVDRIRPAAAQCGIEIDVTEPNHRLSIMGDRRQLVSAVYNLLDNAMKYSNEGSVVQVRSFTNGRTVDLEVEDHGIGIPAADLERIFERFYRVDQARSRQTGGTGLGLAIVRHVATNHDGDVRVESRAGEGSTFSLRFPAAAGPVAVSEAG
jgi:two-component system sensor histidine kinase SenX3